MRWRSLNNEIKGLYINGNCCEEPQKVKDEVHSYFEKRFQAQVNFGVNLDGVLLREIGAADNERLCSTFNDEEILEAVDQCEGTKSPGPDGFNFNFIKSNWNIIRADIINVIQCFYETGYIPRGCNASFITLIPKKESPISLGDYRPISLVGCVFKLIAKILANRLKGVLENVIDMKQFAFLSGGGLLDSVLIANEMVDYLRKDRVKGVIVKVDYEKAYDSVEWNFLEYMMRRLGFVNKWINWISMCLKSTTVSILVNGSPTKEFKPKRGLRQGDPLAPFLFLIMAEGLASLVREAIRIGVLEGIKVGEKEVEVTLLQFADDTLFVCQPNYQSILAIKAILCSFEVVSSLRVNFYKSKVGGVGISKMEMTIFSKCLNCG